MKPHLPAARLPWAWQAWRAQRKTLCALWLILDNRDNDRRIHSMKGRSVFGVFLLVIILSSSCQQSSRVESNKICVSTSVFPIYDMVRNIGGEHLEVFYTVPIGANPHTYEPVPSAIQKLQKADLFLGIHPEFDGWIGDY